MIDGLEGYMRSYLDRLRILGLNTLELRFVRADWIEVYKIFNGLNSLDSERYFVRNVGVIRERIVTSFLRRFKESLDVGSGRYQFGNRVCIRSGT